MHKITKNKDNIILVLMVLLHTLALFVILNFTKAIETYPDELAYYNIAKSLFYNNGVKMHGVSFSTFFQLHNICFNNRHINRSKFFLIHNYLNIFC